MLQDLKELWQYKNLVVYFVVRDFQGRFKQTFLGFSWAIIQPLVMMVVFSLIFSNFLKVDSSGVPYPIFSYVALLPWLFISRSVTASSSSLTGFKSLITKVYFPREIVPLSSMISSLADFFIASGVFVMMLFYFEIEVTWHIVFVALLLPIQIIFAAGMSLVFSSVSAVFRDLSFALPLLVQLWMYATPVIYGLRNIQKVYLPLFYLNPAAGIIEGYRSILLFNEVPNFFMLGSTTLVSFVFLVFGYVLFKKLEGFIIDIL